jgi:hypothetical protein
LLQLFEAFVGALRQVLAKGSVAFLQDAYICAVLVDFLLEGIVHEAHSDRDRLFAHPDRFANVQREFADLIRSCAMNCVSSPNA